MSAPVREDFFTASARRHAEDVAAGNHDQACEFGPRIFADRTGVVMVHMCHCSKRDHHAQTRERTRRAALDAQMGHLFEVSPP